ncbi:hypothetical protein F4778DRAFT_193347 [Xylariomycetidae sp. FL2044]|nr:hypothetical protein F4778DRAFT_193347 [Xylariomycetidae sp. FL2044]
MLPYLHVLIMLPFLSTPARANTEKTIFLGPAPVNLPTTHPNLQDLHIDTLTPSRWAQRTHLASSFPAEASHKYGSPTWLVLDELTEGQRYEVRVCWPATQPTAFKLDTYELDTVFETPELVSELSEYSYSRLRSPHTAAGRGEEQQQQKSGDTPSEPWRPAGPEKEKETSVLFLRILAAADYYTTNETLMRHVPPVHVDIILDPFVGFNVLPRSLVPTVGYIMLVAAVSWFLGRRISTWLLDTAAALEPAAQGMKKDQ